EAQHESESRILAAEKRIMVATEHLPQITELFLRHLDILLDTVRSFLLVSATVFVATLALDVKNIANADICT
ncbi:hypothetical protein ACFL6I_13175, partial [candidate division KSB1 bacterium]